MKNVSGEIDPVEGEGVTNHSQCVGKEACTGFWLPGGGCKVMLCWLLP